MRNDVTDNMADQLQQAFAKSGLSVNQFLTYLDTTRPVFGTKQQTADTQAAFFLAHSGEILHFYFTNNRWWCKA